MQKVNAGRIEPVRTGTGAAQTNTAWILEFQALFVYATPVTVKK